jgi:hypothetical protein
MGHKPAHGCNPLQAFFLYTGSHMPGTSMPVLQSYAGYLDKDAAMSKLLFTATAAALLLMGCAVERVQVGTPRDEVISQYGKPTAVVPTTQGTRLQYSRQPAGQSAIMVDLDATGRVAQVRQVLTEAEFARVQVGQWTRETIEREYGRPAFIRHTAFWKGDILTYRWRDASQDMLFYAYLDPNNLVQQVGQGMEFRATRELIEKH